MGYYAASACPAVAIHALGESRPGFFQRSPSSTARFTSKPQEFPCKTELTGAKTRIGVPTGRSILSTKYLDKETGLYYYGYRFYNPSLGRWPSRDPMEGVLTDIQAYAYVRNSPTFYIDPDGMKPRIPKITPIAIAKCALGEVLKKIQNAYDSLFDGATLNGNMVRFCSSSACQDKKLLDDVIRKFTGELSLGEQIVSMANCLGLTKAEVNAEEEFVGNKTVTISDQGCVTFSASLSVKWHIVTPEIPVPGRRKKDGGGTIIPPVTIDYTQAVPFEKTWCPGKEKQDMVCTPCMAVCGPGTY